MNNTIFHGRSHSLTNLTLIQKKSLITTTTHFFFPKRTIYIWLITVFCTFIQGITQSTFTTISLSIKRQTIFLSYFKTYEGVSYKVPFVTLRTISSIISETVGDKILNYLTDSICKCINSFLTRRTHYFWILNFKRTTTSLNTNFII